MLVLVQHTAFGKYFTGFGQIHIWNAKQPYMAKCIDFRHFFFTGAQPKSRDYIEAV